VFQACRGVVRNDSKISITLLPHLIQNCCVHGSPQELLQIQGEMLAVLQGGPRDLHSEGEHLETPRTSSKKTDALTSTKIEARSQSARHDLHGSGSHVQVIFELIDQLIRWNSEEQAGVHMGNAAELKKNKKQFRSQGHQNQQILIDAIPKRLLADAALRFILFVSRCVECLHCFRGCI